ncbi:MAG: hypothetical protein ACTSP4_15225 [Candidatus Hodarchaeales archaeon]
MSWKKIITGITEKDQEDQEGQSLKEKIMSRAQDTTTPEDISYHVWSWWILLVTVLVIGTFIIIISLSNSKFLFLGLLTLIAMPVIVIYCLIMLIPEIKIFGFTVFDPKKLATRKRLSVGKTIAQTMGREFIRQSPETAFLIFFIIALFIIAIVMAFV